MFDALFKKQWRSPNFNERVSVSPARAEPSMLVLHYTGMETLEAALERLCDKASEVSAHYVVDIDGGVYNLVDIDKRAWHAGKSYWEGLTDVNSCSIGIEIVNKGHEFGYETFPEAQVDSVIDLCRALIGKCAIRADRIVGHSDIAPGRKTDPGEKFPWSELAFYGVGLWPEPKPADFVAAEDLVSNKDAIFELLVVLGYNPMVDREILFTEFHRHFLPEKFEGAGDPGVMDVHSCAALLSLIRQKNQLAG